MGKYFGTDGFRGEANKVLTADHAYKIGRYLGWYYNAAFETKPVLDVECGGGKALHALSECYSRWADEKQKKLDSLPPKSRNVFKGDKELIDSLRSQAADYQKQAEEWMLPEGD